jgi:hypothetical protein
MSPSEQAKASRDAWAFLPQPRPQLSPGNSRSAKSEAVVFNLGRRTLSSSTGYGGKDLNSAWALSFTAVMWFGSLSAGSKPILDPWDTKTCLRTKSLPMNIREFVDHSSGSDCNTFMYDSMAFYTYL